MDLHELWHIVVLAATLLAGAGLAIVLLAPLVFEPPPPGLAKARPLVLVLVGAAGLVFLVEWLVLHGRSL